MLMLVFLSFLCPRIIQVVATKSKQVATDGFVKGTNHDRLLSWISFNHKVVRYSSSAIKKLLGKPHSSLKKISDERNKKSIRKGEKIKLPRKLATEIGNPHDKRIGHETSVIKICSCRKTKTERG